MPTAQLSPAEVTRYARQMALEVWGREAQEGLKSSRVLLAGAGGLASAAALYLLAAGVGSVRLVDHSRISLADLNHQILFRERDLGKAKAAVAAERLKEVNPFAEVEAQVKPLSLNNVSRLASGCTLLLDAMNHLSASHLLNRAAVKLRLPLIHAQVWHLEGRLTTFWPGRGPCLACAFPEVSASEEPALLPPLPGILGTLQALEALRLLGGVGPALLGRMLIFKGARVIFTERSIAAAPHCLVCRQLHPA